MSAYPHIFEGELARAPRLTLRCVVAAPPPATALTAAVLLCQPQGDRPMELDPQVVEPIAPSGWFLSGRGNGLRVWVTGRPAGAQKGDDVKATLQPADQPLPMDAWDHAFWRMSGGRGVQDRRCAGPGVGCGGSYADRRPIVREVAIRASGWIG